MKRRIPKTKNPQPRDRLNLEVCRCAARDYISWETPHNKITKGNSIYCYREKVVKVINDKLCERHKQAIPDNIICQDFLKIVLDKLLICFTAGFCLFFKFRLDKQYKRGVFYNNE